MIFPLWPPVAVVAILVILLVLIILIYGDHICARVRTHTDRIAVRARPSLEPMMRRGGGGSGGGGDSRYHAHPQFHQQHEEQARYHSQQHQIIEEYDEAPMELQRPATTTTYGREIEV